MAYDEDGGTEVEIKYANVKAKIREAIGKSLANPFLLSPLKKLNKTFCSMKPMVEDLRQSFRPYTLMTNSFLQLLNQFQGLLDDFIRNQPAALSIFETLIKDRICRAFGLQLPESSRLAVSWRDKLDTVWKDLKGLYKEYVINVMNNLVLENQEETDEEELTKLLSSLDGISRNEALEPSSNHVLRKIKKILSFLRAQSYTRRKANDPVKFDMPRLVGLLKEVQPLVRFLNGDHGLDITNRLQENEYELRKFVNADVTAELDEIDRCYYERQQTAIKGATMIILLILFLGTCVIVLECSSEVTTLAIVILKTAYDQVVQVFPHFIWGQSQGQSQSSNSSNSSFGGFQFMFFVGLVAAAIAIVTDVTDEPKKYDIFLNFRGDIRFTVPGIFHTSLEKANISTFFDERNARKTKRFMDEINMAISTSLGAITIFSELYGESEYCLDELLLILEREKTHKGYMIRPIFYDVEPDDLTDPKSKFGQGLQKLYTDQQKDKVEKWKEALENVICISGDVYKSTHQHLDILVSDVVEDFKKRLRNKRHPEYKTNPRLRRLIMKLAQLFAQVLENFKILIDLMNQILDT